MTHFLAGIYSVFATMPFISFFIILLIALLITKDKKESFKWAIHITMFFLLSVVGALMKEVTGSLAGFWWMVILLILVGGLLIFMQWKIRQQILLGRVLRLVWFLGFLLFSVMYILLFFIGIFQEYRQT